MQKPDFLMVWGCISVHGIDDLHMCEDTIDAEVYNRFFGKNILEQLKSCILQELTQTLVAKLQEFVSSVPKRLKSVIKKKGDVTPW